MLAKNDRIDAATIARFCAALPQREVIHDPVRAMLGELVTARRQLCEERTRCANQAEQTASALLKRIAAQRIKRLSAEMALVEAEIARLIAGNPELAERNAIMRSVPGVGPTTAATLLAFMPELGAMSARQAASLAGVAPFDCESGAFRGKRRIAGGRKPPRDALYMAALVASRRNTAMAAAYRNLRNAGKPAKVALVAIMRKLVTALNAMIRNKQQWAAA